MMGVETGDDLDIAVVKRDGMDADEDLGGKEGRRRGDWDVVFELEGRDGVEVGRPAVHVDHAGY